MSKRKHVDAEHVAHVETVFEKEVGRGMQFGHSFDEGLGLKTIIYGPL